MKNSTIYILAVISLLAAGCSISKAQTNKVKEVKLDFEKMETDIISVDNIGELKEGDFYRLVINNINLNRYKVSVGVRDSIITKSISAPSYSNLQLDALSGLVQSVGAVISKSEKFSNRNELPSNWIASNNLPTTKMQHRFADAMKTSEETDRDDEYSKILNQLINYKDSLIKFSSKLKNFNQDIDHLKTISFMNRLYLLDYIDLKNPIENQNFVEQSANIRTDLKKTSDDLLQYQLKYYEFEKENIDRLSKDDFIGLNKVVKEAIVILLESESKVMDAISPKEIENMLNKFVYLNKEKQSTYKSIPFQFNGDRSIVNYHITPRKEEFNLQSYSGQLVFPNRQPKFVSVGLSFYFSTLHDEAYSLQGALENDTTFRYRFVDEGTSKYEMGIASLIRVGNKPDSREDIFTHLSFGPGVSLTNKVRPRFLLGGGFSKGVKHMIALDFGGVIGPVDRKSNAINLQELYLEPPNQATISDLKIGFFASIGYHFNF
ncbi:hypothetical protein C9994_09785 [Marivirga lumbricoides]|uniref:Outer membrane protein beta-barrel domain-containing protein n=1 Tax=Marivirga lumbricoides TaxID=1046115 RepID=A0A2T4DPZ9_9BACT|nr:hypothetical protein C9994_09785 [Marivirga lumbricoides]